jgi:hypothetical protein
MDRKKVDRQSPNRNRTLWYLGAAFVVVIIAVGLYLGLAGNRSQTTQPPANSTATPASPAKLAQANGQEIDGVRCETTESLQFHIHILLVVYLEDQQQTIPAQIGIPGTCLYWLHTHDTSGVIHVESPVQRDYVLGNFFDIWGKPLDATHLLGRVADAQHSVRTYVDGKLYMDNPRAIVLKDHEEILLMYGPPFTDPANAPPFPPDY